jgi:hypothetical protein
MMGLGSKYLFLAMGAALLLGPAAQAERPDLGITEDRPGTQAQIRTLEGLDKDALTCSCQSTFGACLLAQKTDKVVTFVLPEGYKRLSFSQTVTPQGVHSGGRVYWETENPYDARVHLECYADFLSSAEVAVSGVLAIKE